MNKLCERARGASELGKFSHFHILKLLFLQYSVGTSDTLSPYIFRSQITSSYTYNPVISYGMALYINDSIIPTKH